jgi:hypothetical protein
MHSTNQLELEQERVLLKGHYKRLAIKHFRQTQAQEWKKFIELFQYLFHLNTFSDFQPKGLCFLYPYSEKFYSKKEADSLMHFSQSDPDFFFLYDETAWKVPVALALLEFKKPVTSKEVSVCIRSLGGVPAGRNDLMCLYLTVGLHGLPRRKIILGRQVLPASEESKEVLSLQQFEGPLFSMEPDYGTWSNHYLFAVIFPLG